MGDILRLYRGDNSKIKEFDFHKTDKHCYVGQGIYLTNDISLADTYRTKGARYREYMPDNTICQGAYHTKNDAIQAGLEGYARYHWEQDNQRYWKKEDLSKYITKLRSEYLMKIETGEIEFERTANYEHSSGKPRFRFKACIAIRGVGYVTVFEFPRMTFERDVIKICVSPRSIDEGFLELVFEHKCYRDIDYSRGYQSFKETIFKPVNLKTIALPGSPKPLRRLSGAEKAKAIQELKNMPGWSISRLKHNRLIEVLRPYGFKGFEYEGGVNTGGKRHRAFSIWDDEYVNTHRVNRIK